MTSLADCADCTATGNHCIAKPIPLSTIPGVTDEARTEQDRLHRLPTSILLACSASTQGCPKFSQGFTNQYWTIFCALTANRQMQFYDQESPRQS
jgi:hypothetical protein